jgi:redox-sensing transcriptional repressor
VILVGVGHLGSALLGYNGFAREGFEVVAAFDLVANRERAANQNIPLYGMAKLKTYIDTHSIKMAILTVPGRVGQEVANQLVAAGIQAILNFAPVVLEVPDGVMVNNVDLAIELENLSYFIR